MRALVAVAACVTLIAATTARGADGSVAARVNGTAISTQEVQRLSERVARGANTNVDQVWNDALDQLVTLEMLDQAARAEGLKVSKAEVDQEFKDLKAQPGIGEELLEGTTEADFRRELQRSLLIQKLLDKHIKVKVTPEQIEAFYKANPEEFQRPETVRASHILIRIEANDAPAARKQAEAILARLNKGEDFAKLAKEFSQDPLTASKGGDLGFFPQRGTPVAQTAFQLKPGQISGIVPSAYGLHIIKVTDSRPSGVASLAEASGDIKQLLEEEQQEDQEDTLINELKKKAKIELLQQKAPSAKPNQGAARAS